MKSALTPGALSASTPAELPEPEYDEQLPVSSVDHRELARFLRPQPPRVIPARTRVSPPAGLLAAQLLGARVHTRGSR